MDKAIIYVIGPQASGKSDFIHKVLNCKEHEILLQPDGKTVEKMAEYYYKERGENIVVLSEQSYNGDHDRALRRIARYLGLKYLQIQINPF